MTVYTAGGGLFYNPRDLLDYLCSTHTYSIQYAEHTRMYTKVMKTNKSPSDAKLSHRSKQINTLLLFPVPSGTLDVYSMEEEAHTAAL